MVRSALALFVFGLMAIPIGIPVCLIGLVYPSRRVYAWSATLWANTMLAICGVRLKVEGAEFLQGDNAKFFVGNHQSILDVPILISVLGGRFRFLSLDRLFQIPIAGWVMSAYGHVPIDQNRPRVALARLTKMVEAIHRRPISMAVFLEGTRSIDGKLLPFRKGTMKICQRAGLMIVPFTIDGSVQVCRRNQMGVQPGEVRLRFSQPLSVEEVAAMTPGQIHDYVRERIAAGLRPAADTEAECIGAMQGAMQPAAAESNEREIVESSPNVIKQRANAL